MAQWEDYVSVSEVARVNTCPVRHYFERDLPFTESGKYIVCKQISYHLGSELDTETIWNEVLAVSPTTDPSLRPYLESCVSSCSRAEWRRAVETDRTVFSDKYRTAGMADRIFDDGTFSIIRAAGAMPFGTYVSDRLRIAALALCIGEMTGSEVCGGNVEYIPDGTSRYHAIQPRDRRRLLDTLRRAREIKNGALPSRPLNAPCHRCMYQQRCEQIGGRRLSDLL